MIAACTEEAPMAEHDDQAGGSEQDEASESPDYTEEEQAAFGVWVELGAREPSQQPLLDLSFSVKWERREPSGSGWVMRLLRNPIPLLLEERVPGVRPDSRVTTTILHHHRGLERRVIVVTATVEQQSGDVALVIDKETRED
jgi:hypothetical protein